ncbi:uncharacterized protein LOC135470910 [Liolophura sinensis]|uniref:uncharacterized protein LOC135470910 n=1 Tax=Liolophura sinensis TaxID=3198878 RepID=UPI00315881AB
MEPSKQMTFKQKHGRGTDFLRYLDTENISINGMSKEQMKSHYDSGYSLYRRQIHPDEKRINFATILFTLTHTGFVRLYGKKAYLGHVPRNVASRRKTSPKSNHESSPAKQSPEEGPRAKPRQRRRKKPAVAVDQHMILKQSESVTKSIQETTEQEQLPNTGDGNVFNCQLCLVKCHSYKEYQSHLQGKRHRLKVITTGLRKNKSIMTQDKDGIELTGIVSETSESTSADTVTLELREGDSSSVIFRIENKAQEDLIFLRCETLKRVRVFTVYDVKKVTDGMKQINIPPGHQYDVTVKTKVSQVGTFHSPLAFQFKRLSNLNDFVYIIRFLCLRVTNDIVDELGPTEKYRKPPRVSGRRDDDVEIIDGVRPSGV